MIINPCLQMFLWALYFLYVFIFFIRLIKRSAINEKDQSKNFFSGLLPQELVRMGIPHHFRAIVWQLLCNAQNMPIKDQYSELLKMTSPCEKLIRRDIARTYPEHEFFKEKDSLGQEVLFNVMKVSRRRHNCEVSCRRRHWSHPLPPTSGVLSGGPRGGILSRERLHRGTAAHAGEEASRLPEKPQRHKWSQGLTSASSSPQMPEEEAFCVFVKLMQDYRLRELFKPSMAELGLCMYQFECMIQEQLPELHMHFQAQSFHTSMYASSWFLTIFLTSFPLPVATRIFDIFMCEVRRRLWFPVFSLSSSCVCFAWGIL